MDLLDVVELAASLSLLEQARLGPMSIVTSSPKDDDFNPHNQRLACLRALFLIKKSVAICASSPFWGCLALNRFCLSNCITNVCRRR